MTASKAAVITGASSGIGRATAEAFAEEGIDVTLAARTESRLREIADELTAEYGIDALPIGTDVRDEADVEAMVAETVDHFGRLDVVVNNAGILRSGIVEDLSTADYRAMMETQTDGTFFTTRAALPHVRRSEGTLVFVGSFTGRYPNPFTPVYSASKYWVRGFAHSVEAHVGDAGVSVSVVNPSEVRSGLEVDGVQMQDALEPGEAVEPSEVAAAIVFAVQQDTGTLSEVDLFTKDRLSDLKAALRRSRE
jgi:hypothetical protein